MIEYKAVGQDGPAVNPLQLRPVGWGENGWTIDGKSVADRELCAWLRDRYRSLSEERRGYAEARVEWKLRHLPRVCARIEALDELDVVYPGEMEPCDEPKTSAGYGRRRNRLRREHAAAVLGCRAELRLMELVADALVVTDPANRTEIEILLDREPDHKRTATGLEQDRRR